MPNATGVIQKIWPNNGKPAVVLADGSRYSCFKKDQLGQAQEGAEVSFAYDTAEVNGKTYFNVKGQVAVVSAPAPGAAPAASQSHASMRNGQQVGASINQAIAAMSVLGTEPTLDNIENLAQSFLLMGDRLATYKG